MKLPAYGKRLLEARRRGEHPLVVHLVYAEDLRRLDDRCDLMCDGSHPSVVVKPSEFFPGAYDWRALAGCCVEIFDPHWMMDGGMRHLRVEHEADTAVQTLFLKMVTELGRVAGPIWIHGQRGYPLAPQWLAWWPADVEAINVKRREAWGRSFIAWCDGRWADTANRAA